MKSKFKPRVIEYAPLGPDWQPPTEDDPFFKAMRPLLNLVMAYHRYTVEGMDLIPPEGGAIVVVNHSLATYDSFLLGAAIFFESGRFPVGLADRRIFQTPGISQLFTRLGAVQGSPESAEWLLQQKHLLILAPGGMRESLRPSSRKYQIDWERRYGFVRLAVKTQVPVILAACPAADDIYKVYDNPITPFIYRHLKWPLPIARGIGLTAMPRPVKLVHHLSHPMPPPPLRNGLVDEADVKTFHASLVETMDTLMHDG